jgi:hypothetical protein
MTEQDEFDQYMSQATDGYFQSGGTGLFGFRMKDVGKKYHAFFLTNLLMPLRVHFAANTAPSICNFTYYPKDRPQDWIDQNPHCPECAKPSSNPQYKNNNPQDTRQSVIYVAELVGAKNGEYAENPEKLLSIPPGRGKLNFSVPQEAKDEGELLEKCFILQKTAEVSFMPMQKEEAGKIMRKLNIDEDKLREARARWAAMPLAEQRSRILANYKNARFDYAPWVRMGLKEPEDVQKKEDKKEEKKLVANTALSSKDLD